MFIFFNQTNVYCGQNNSKYSSKLEFIQIPTKMDYFVIFLPIETFSDHSTLKKIARGWFEDFVTENMLNDNIFLEKTSITARIG